MISAQPILWFGGMENQCIMNSVLHKNLWKVGYCLKNYVRFSLKTILMSKGMFSNIVAWKYSKVYQYIFDRKWFSKCIKFAYSYILFKATVLNNLIIILDEFGQN